MDIIFTRVCVVRVRVHLIDGGPMNEGMRESIVYARQEEWN